MRMSAKTGRGMNPMLLSSSDQISTNWRAVETPRLCINSVNIIGSDSSGMYCFL